MKLPKIVEGKPINLVKPKVFYIIKCSIIGSSNITPYKTSKVMQEGDYIFTPSKCIGRVIEFSRDTSQYNLSSLLEITTQLKIQEI